MIVCFHYKQTFFAQGSKRLIHNPARELTNRYIFELLIEIKKMTSQKKYRVGIVGATGAVGQEIIRLLMERGFPFSEIKLYASARSAGKTIQVGDFSGVVEETTDNIFKDLDLALFSAGGSISKEFCWKAVEQGCVVVDNSSAFRGDDRVPLVVPEINEHALKAHNGLIANPNCSTAIALMGLYPLHKEFGLKRVIASTYQAVSGTGAAAIEELDKQSRAVMAGEQYAPVVYPHTIAFNLIPHVDSFLDDGYTKEEMKMLHEGKKILELADLKVSCTCVRVPVFRAHSISVCAEFEKPVDLERARACISSFEGAELCDDPKNNKYPMPLDYAGKVKCGVGRIRKDSALDNGIAFWVSGDQLWKGAALNAVQIAESLHSIDKLSI